MERSLMMSDFPIETTRAVAVAYRKVMQRDAMDHRGAMDAAYEAHRSLHPNATQEERSAIVIKMIALVSAQHTEWFNRGVVPNWEWPRKSTGRMF